MDNPVKWAEPEDTPPQFPWLPEFKQLYPDLRLRNTIYRHVQLHGGNREAAHDLLHDTFVVLYTQLENGQFRGESTLFTYCVGIAKQLWFNRQRRTLRLLPLEEVPAEYQPDGPELSERDAQRIDVLNHILENQLDAGARRLLTLYSFGLSFQEIAHRTGAPSADAAKQKTYRCLQRLLKLIRNHPDLVR